MLYMYTSLVFVYLTTCYWSKHFTTINIPKTSALFLFSTLSSTIAGSRHCFWLPDPHLSYNRHGFCHSNPEENDQLRKREYPVA